MEETLFAQEYMLRAVDVDIRGAWMPSAIFVMMQESAELHAELVGLGRRQLSQSYGLAWVVTRMHLQMHRYPKLGDVIQVRTWPLTPTNLVFRRQFQFLDADGQELGRASSQWVLFDLTDRIIRRTSVLGAYPHNPDAEILLPDPKKIRVPKDLLEMDKRRVLYSDVDMNGHMNNTKYLNWICELFPTRFLEAMQMSEIQIAYVSEARIDQLVTLFAKEEDEGMYVCGRTGEKNVFDSLVRWTRVSA